LSHFYTSVIQRRDKILVRGYLDGQRFSDTIEYKPTLYLPTTDESEYRTIFDKPVAPKTLPSIPAARNMIQMYEGISNANIYGLDKFGYTYIYEQFQGEIKYNPDLINVWFLDIETSTAEPGFPNIETADREITTIGIRIKNKVYSFGCKPYVAKESRVKYILCKDEVDLLTKFMKFYASSVFMPDVISGWNIEKFDIPYIVNRLRRVLGETKARKLSPWGILQEKVVEFWGKETTIYLPLGVAILDYLPIYKKFTYNQQESYTLDHIAFIETGKRKLDYSEYASLQELYEQNYEKFIDYNIADCDRVFDIDAKMKLVELIFAIAYDAKVNYEDTLGTVNIWDIIIHNHLMDSKIVVPFKLGGGSSESIVGGHVKKPKDGMYHGVVSFDFTSLYPMLIRMLNISPDTYYGKIDLNSEQLLDMSYDTAYLKDEGLTLAANGTLFRVDKQGFLPFLMAQQFKLRDQYKKKMLAAKQAYEHTPTREIENQIAQYNNAQMAKKIQLNSLFGAVANKHFRWHNSDLAEAITLSGQISVRFVTNRINKFLNEKFGTKDKDYIIAIDTDSCYIDMSGFTTDPSLTKLQSIELLDQTCKTVIQPVINQAIDQFSAYLNAFEKTLDMKREAIADRGIWTGKKHYVLNVWNNEGVQYAEPKLKIMGLEAVRSSTPQMCRDAIKKSLSIIMNGTQDDLIEYLEEFRQLYFSSDFDIISKPSGINGLAIYADPVTIYKKSTPIHVKGALIYNNLLTRTGLDKKHSPIFDKEKVKWCYLKLPNPVFSPVISFPKMMPRELNLNKYIDYQTMYEKVFLGAILSITNAIDWSVEHKDTLESFFE
jgi:DNA polymerase elongation subunit (family B)